MQNMILARSLNHLHRLTSPVGLAGERCAVCYVLRVGEAVYSLGKVGVREMTVSLSVSALLSKAPGTLTSPRVGHSSDIRSGRPSCVLGRHGRDELQQTA